MAHAYENRSTMHNDAVVRLIDKLIVNPIFVREETSEHLSKDIDAFFGRFSNVTNLLHS